ncbi:MAG: hypothetical protein R8G60_13120 [Roseovarius pacificus]|nr:hypothetical protein [Roseovarius pacificus]
MRMYYFDESSFEIVLIFARQHMLGVLAAARSRCDTRVINADFAYEFLEKILNAADEENITFLTEQEQRLKVLLLKVVNEDVKKHGQHYE